MSARRWNDASNWSPITSTACWMNLRPPPPPRAPRSASHSRSRPGAKRSESQYRVQRGELFDDVAGARRDVGIVGTREPATARDQILQHHHVVVAVGLGVPDARHAYIDVVRDLAVEARFGDAHAGLVDERALLFVEGRKLHEDARRESRLAAERHACASRGSRAAIHDGRLDHVATEHLREPARIELVDLGGELRRHTHEPLLAFVADLAAEVLGGVIGRRGDLDDRIVSLVELEVQRA